MAYAYIHEDGVRYSVFRTFYVVFTIGMTTPFLDRIEWEAMMRIIRKIAGDFIVVFD